MKCAGLALVWLIWGLSAAFASNSDGPIRYRAHGMTVIAHAKTETMTVQVGDNPLDKPHTFTCQSTAGCLVVMSASDMETDTLGTKLCPLVDGQDGIPACWYEATGYTNTSLQFANEQRQVGPGQHTLQTLVRSDNTEGQVLGWQVTYTIYERKTKGTE